MLLSYRIWPALWHSDEQFTRLVDLLSTYPEAVDEIALFDETFPTVAYSPLDRVERTADLLRKRMADLRALGFRSVGINVMFTLGHGDSPDGIIDTHPFPPMIGHDGQVSTGSTCPSSPEFLAYTKRRYGTMAAAKPDFVWVDDDFRMSHHGPTYPCFCGNCLERFTRSQELGHAVTRQRLVAWLDDPRRGDLRRAWSEFCAASLESVCADIRDAVTAVDPNIELGLMTIGYSHSTYAGHSIRRYMKALGAVRGRPGHGYYTDECRLGLLDKALDVGRLVVDYPEEVRIIQYELENYPYITLGKAVKTVLNECTVSLMMGCNGIALNALPKSPGPLVEYMPLLRDIAAERSAWSTLVEHAAGIPLVGLWPAADPQLMANREVDARGWFWESGPYDIRRPNHIAEMGFPLTPDPSTACGILLAGKIAEAFSDRELERMLSTGVLLDAEALNVLWQRGYGELTGVRPNETFPKGIIERFTDHELNGLHVAECRDALVGEADSVCSLKLVGKAVGDLAHLVRYNGEDLGCCLSTYANELGGRIVVSTYAPWHRLGLRGKQTQLLGLLDWMSDGQLPAWVRETTRVVPFARRSEDGRRLSVVLLNTALDSTGVLHLHLRARPERVLLVSNTGLSRLPLQQGENRIVVTVPCIPAWGTAILVGY